MSQRSKKINFYLYIYNFVKQNERLPKPKTLEISKQNMQYYVSYLKEIGVIENMGYAVWRVTEIPFDGKEVQKEVKKVNDVTAKHIRGHGYVFSYQIPLLDNWNRREVYLRNFGIPFTSIKQGQRIVVNGKKVWLCATTITIYFSPNESFYEESSELASARALLESKHVIRQIEKMLKVDFKVNQKYVVTESRSHYAHIRNALAKIYHEKGVHKFEIKQNGKTWALIDNSLNLLEFETILGGGQSKNDMVVVQKFFNTIKDDPKLIDDLNDVKQMREILKESLNEIKSITESQKESFEQIRSLAYLMQEHIKTKH